MALIQAEPEAATRMLGECRRLGERVGLEPVLAYVEVMSGMAVTFRYGDPDLAIEHCRESVRRHRALGDPAGEALGLAWLATAYSFQGDSVRAVAYGEELGDLRVPRGHLAAGLRDHGGRHGRLAAR